MYSKGVGFYLAPTADARDTWQATMRHIACEGHTFVLGCNQFLTKSMYPSDLEGIEDLANQPEILCRGGSAIISPLGEILAGPLFDEEGILTAELDPAEITRGKLDFRRRRSLRTARCVQANNRRASVALGDTRGRVVR